VNTAPITAFLADQLGDELVAAFVYGSVASGRRKPGSDIDCFVLTRDELTPQRRTQIASGFTELQLALGFTPDPDYPVEVFSVSRCEDLLSGHVLDQVLRSAAVTGVIDPALLEGDQVEVLRALVDSRLILRQAPALDHLTGLARAVLHRHTDAPAIRHALRLPEASP
jgi:polymorphic toxin system nucleotidyltransferase-like protein